VLGIADDDSPFFLHTDASDFGVGAVLSQFDSTGKLQPLGFMSRKLSDTEYRWSTYEKELYAVVAALRHWDMHLMGARHPVTVYTDHHSLMYLISQPKLSAKQTRWYDCLSSFQLQFKHVSGSVNSAADALSRRADHDVGVDARQQIRSDIAKAQFISRFPGLNGVKLNALLAESTITSTELLDEIIAGYVDDQTCTEILADPSRFHYEVRWGALHRMSDGSVRVPNVPALKTRILREMHDAPTSAHLGVNKTYSRISALFYWPNMFIDVRDWVKSCIKCQASKHLNMKPAGLMNSIEIVPKGHTITMDFVGPMTRTARGKDCILVMVDKFSKRAFYTATTVDATASDVAKIVFQQVVRHQGLPRVIISDRDSKFLSSFWSSLWEMMGTKLAKSTSYHPQSDGQTERQNRSMLEALRSYVNKKGSDWDLHLTAIEIANNSSINASTQFSPFKLDVGIDVRLPATLATESRTSKSSDLDATEFIASMDQDFIDAHSHLLAAQQRQEKYSNVHRREEIYQVGDIAWLETKHLNLKKGSQKLLPRWAGPFLVTSVKNRVNATLDLPESWDIHSTFHVSRLKHGFQLKEDRFPGREDSILSTHVPSSTLQSNTTRRVDEQQQSSSKRPYTRRTVQQLQKAGETIEFAQQTTAWDRKRAREQQEIAASQADLN
jgi:transposase InsO family protein